MIWFTSRESSEDRSNLDNISPQTSFVNYITDLLFSKCNKIMQLFIIRGHCFIGYKSKFCELENCLLFKSFIMKSILYSCLSITTIYLSINACRTTSMGRKRTNNPKTLIFNHLLISVTLFLGVLWFFCDFYLKLFFPIT